MLIILLVWFYFADACEKKFHSIKDERENHDKTLKQLQNENDEVKQRNEEITEEVIIYNLSKTPQRFFRDLLIV